MKRIKSACICQTLHFLQKDDTDRALAARLVSEEVLAYKRRLDHTGTAYRILEEETQPDGSVIMKIIKQYNQSPVGDYLD